MVVNDKPYLEQQLSHNTFIRTFDQTIHPNELVWHRDREDRIIEALEDSDWYIQLDNNLPQQLLLNQTFSIPMGVYHRVIKGSGTLIVKLIKNY